MRTTVVGAGPTGLFLGMSLARRGHHVAIIDRDPGPTSSGHWDRKGVMQFALPHFFRPQVRSALLAELPEVADSVLAAGALLTPVNPTTPDIAGMRMRRVVFERVLRAAAAQTKGVTMVVGHADEVAIDAGRASGVVVDGTVVDADLVIDASGRSGRFADRWRAPAVGGDCGFSYVSRHYQLRATAEPGPINAPPGWVGEYDGYLVIVFLQDAGTFQVLIVRRSDDDALATLRHEAAFNLAVQTLPSTSTWVDQDRAAPTSPPMAGAGLYNAYRGQLSTSGELAVRGLLFVGDAVLTTNPAAARGVTTSFMQAQRLLDSVDEHGHDFDSVSLDFDAWCTATMKPWFDDQVRGDAGLLSRWRGEPTD